MTEKQVEARVSVLQYINTVLLTFISICSVTVWLSVKEVKTEQQVVGKELIRMKTIQEGDAEKIKDLISKVYTLEFSKYINRPQNK